MRLIAIEGLDNAYKRDVAAALVTRAAALDEKIVTHRFPSEQSPLGDLLADWRMHPTRDAHTFELLQAADKQEAQLIMQVCADFQTDTFLVQRYIHALYAYGSVACEQDWLVHLTQAMRRPDLVLYLDIDSETALRRGGFLPTDLGYDKEHAACEAVRYGYELAFREERLGTAPVVRIPAHQSREVVVAQAMQALVLHATPEV